MKQSSVRLLKNQIISSFLIEKFWGLFLCLPMVYVHTKIDWEKKSRMACSVPPTPNGLLRYPLIGFGCCRRRHAVSPFSSACWWFRCPREPAEQKHGWSSHNCLLRWRIYSTRISNTGRKGRFPQTNYTSYVRTSTRTISAGTVLALEDLFWWASFVLRVATSSLSVTVRTDYSIKASLEKKPASIFIYTGGS